MPPCVRACLLQWAKIILIIEQTMTTEARRHQQKRYSQPMKDKRRALPIRWDRREGIRRSGLSLSLCTGFSLLICTFFMQPPSWEAHTHCSPSICLPELVTVAGQISLCLAITSLPHFSRAGFSLSRALFRKNVGPLPNIRIPPD